MSHAEPPEEKETGRIEAFSDGVFAIAITLLVLEMKVPKPEELHGGRLSDALFRLWPSYLAFLTSFGTILVMWVNHHRLFNLVRRSDHAFLFWNGLLLMFVTFIPFPTALLADYLLDPQARVAAGFYSGTFFLTALAFNGLWHHAARGGRLLGRQVDMREVDGITRQYSFGPISYLIAFLFSFAWPWATTGICLGLAVFFAFRKDAE